VHARSPFHGSAPFDPTSAHCRVAGGRAIYATKVKALPESLGQCKLLETLCVPRPPPVRVRVRGGAGAALLPRALPRSAQGWHHVALNAAAEMLPVVGRRPSPAHAWLARAARPARGTGWGRSRPAEAARSARRNADDTELAALPAAAEWPSLKIL
jgi:hypothetical protein